MASFFCQLSSSNTIRGSQNQEEGKGHGDELEGQKAPD